MLKNPPPRLSDSFTFLKAFAITGRVELTRETYFIIFMRMYAHLCACASARTNIIMSLLDFGLLKSL